MPRHIVVCRDKDVKAYAPSAYTEEEFEETEEYVRVGNTKAREAHAGLPAAEWLLSSLSASALGVCCIVTGMPAGPGKQGTATDDRCPIFPVFTLHAVPRQIDKPFVEKPVSGEDHNVCIYYPHTGGGGMKRLFRKARAPETDNTHLPHPNSFMLPPPPLTRPCPLLLPSPAGWQRRQRVLRAQGGGGVRPRPPRRLVSLRGLHAHRRHGRQGAKFRRRNATRRQRVVSSWRLLAHGARLTESFPLPRCFLARREQVYTVGPNYAHAEARKSPVVDGRVLRDENGKEIRYPVVLTPEEKDIARRVVLAFGQSVCGFDLLRCKARSPVSACGVENTVLICTKRSASECFVLPSFALCFCRAAATCVTSTGGPSSRTPRSTMAREM